MVWQSGNREGDHVFLVPAPREGSNNPGLVRLHSAGQMGCLPSLHLVFVGRHGATRIGHSKA